MLRFGLAAGRRDGITLTLNIFNRQRNDEIQALEESIIVAAVHMGCTYIIAYCLIDSHNLFKLLIIRLPLNSDLLSMSTYILVWWNRVFVIYPIIKFYHQHCNENTVAECHFDCQFGRNVYLHVFACNSDSFVMKHEIKCNLILWMTCSWIPFSLPALQRECRCWLSHCQCGQDNNAHILVCIFRFIHHVDML